MKRIIYAALACLTFASCEDFLDKLLAQLDTLQDIMIVPPTTLTAFPTPSTPR